jgi:hypothetical protein
MSKWQPIETAPKTPKRVLLWGTAYGDPIIATAYWDDDPACPHCHGWHFIQADDGMEYVLEPDEVVYTHWMPMPEPPDV